MYITGYFNLTGFAMGNIQIMAKKRFISIILTSSFCFFIPSAAHAGVYKWVDEDGQVHYGEQPGNSNAEKVTIRTNETTTPRTINKAEEEEAENKDGEKKDKTDAEKYGELKEVPPSEKEKRKLCNEAKHDLALITSRGRMREINEKGEYIRITEEQRQQRISANKKKKKKYCR
jgi:hypothetical protein